MNAYLPNWTSTNTFCLTKSICLNAPFISTSLCGMRIVYLSLISFYPLSLKYCLNCLFISLGEYSSFPNMVFSLLIFI